MIILEINSLFDGMTKEQILSDKLAMKIVKIIGKEIIECVESVIDVKYLIEKGFTYNELIKIGEQ